MKKFTSVYIDSGDCVTPMGFSLEENCDKIKQGQTAIERFYLPNISKERFYGAIIDSDLLDDAFNTLNKEGAYSKLEKMMVLSAQKLIEKYREAINEDCGLIISTTKGNIESLDQEKEQSYYLSDLAQKVAKSIGITSEPIVLSNACVSGIMAVAVAKKLIQIGEYKHFIIIGGDLFTRFVFSGFQSFQAISNEICKPYDKARSGITLGEAAAAVFVTKEKELIDEGNCFEVVGESSINDANHISGPSRTGEGLFLSVNKALKEADLSPDQIDCITAHGTATVFNDEMEAQAFNRLNLEQTPLFSLKAYFGHTLGATGLLDTLISLAFANENKILPSLGYKEHGLTLPLNVNKEFQEKEIEYVLKTASGFGGSNTAVIFKKH